MASNLLSKSQIEDLLINVLGCTNVKGWKQDKISCCCPVHGEKNPSFGVNCNYVPEGSSEVLQVFNCFSKDTKVITSKGVLPISDLLNAPCSIINGKGVWETVQFKSFGFSRLMKVVLTSNGKEKVVYATPNHRWFVQNRKSEVLTCELKPKHRLKRMWLKQPKEFVLNKEALLHGFIVKSVEFTNRIEKVYCCQTSTGSFVLDGFILTGNCFSCGASGSLPRLLLLSQPERFTSFANAVNFLENRYGVAYGKVYKNKRSKVRIRRYGEIVEETGKKTLPKVTLALYKSGKETYTYFFNRGFDEADMKEYMIGRDIENKTVTIPVFWEDKSLAGVIGRYISKNRKHNERYRIYEFEKSKVLFPLDKLEVRNSTIILVESQFDAMMMRKWGIKNVLATMGGTISKAQSDIVASKCSKVILLFDNDEGGKKVVERAKSLLKGKVRFLPFQYPDISLGKDPSEWGKEETLKILSSVGKVHINRL